MLLRTSFNVHVTIRVLLANERTNNKKSPTYSCLCYDRNGSNTVPVVPVVFDVPVVPVVPVVSDVSDRSYLGNIVPAHIKII